MATRCSTSSPAGRSLRIAGALLLAALPIPGGTAAQAPDNPLVRVGLFGGRESAQCLVAARGGAIALTGPQGRLATLPQGGRAQCSASGEGWTLALPDQTWHLAADAAVSAAPQAEGALVAVGVGEPAAYRGTAILSRAGGGLRIINVLPLEDYLRGVLPAEMPRSFHPQALRAQAVVARTFALRRMGSHGRRGYDVCDTGHCQVYRGAAREKPETDAAISATRGIVLTHEGRFISAVYHAACGGATAPKEAVWSGGPVPYLRGVSDDLDGKPACAPAPHFRWETTVTGEELAKVMGAPIEVFEVAGRHPSGRVTLLRGAGGKTLTIPGYDFYLRVSRALGWGRVKNTWFEVEPTSEGWRFTGRGSGHGVGLCQWGAQGRARAGWTFEPILTHYYPGAALARLDPRDGRPVPVTIPPAAPEASPSIDWHW